MENKKVGIIRNKTKILVTHKKTGIKEIWKSLQLFADENAPYKIDTLRYYITRQGIPYEDATIKVERLRYYHKHTD